MSQPYVLPTVSMFMIVDYLNKTSYINRGKYFKSSDNNKYGDDAIGSVQINRKDNTCTVKALVSPDGKRYNCTFACNEENNEIIHLVCETCKAEGNCCHEIALLMWLHRRSEEQPSNEQKSYWAKPKQADIKKRIRFSKAKDMFPLSDDHKTTVNSNTDSFLDAVVKSLQDIPNESHLSKYFMTNELKDLSLHNLIYVFKRTSECGDDFLKFCSSYMTSDKCCKIEEATLKQIDSDLCLEMCYCRIMASQAHETGLCNEKDGVLIEKIFCPNLDSSSKTDRMFKEKVKAKVSEQMRISIEDCGILLKSECPIFCAKPDGLTTEYVIEIKCPNSIKRNIIKKDYALIKNKAEINIDMYFSGRQKGLIIVAYESFEVDGGLDIYEVPYDEKYCSRIIDNATQYWKDCVYKKLAETVS